MVTSVEGSSRLVRRQLGRRLRKLREVAGKTHEDIVESHIASRTKMWKIEHGHMAVKPGDVLALARLYGLEGPATDELVALADATRSTSFHEDYGASVPEWVGLYGDLEAAAVQLQDYQCELIHGLLQTAEYARAATAVNPALSPEVVEQRVNFRMRRQKAFFERPRPGRLESIVTAGALELAVGSDEVMVAQVAHLREICARDEVSVRVLTRANGVHIAMRGPFTILDFDDPDDPSLVYLESFIGSRYVERPGHVDEFRGAFDQMRAQAIPLEEYLA